MDARVSFQQKRSVSDCDKRLVHYDWRGPGDRPIRDYTPSRPIPKPVVSPSLAVEAERELVRRYQKNGDEEALEQLVGAYRPMLVSMARSMWRGNGTKLQAVIEYGVMGMKTCAHAPRPSLTKKGEMVGFDLTKGYRFGTYARREALAWMKEALADDPKPERSPE